MSLFPMRAPVAFAQANAIQSPSKSYAINGGITNIDGTDLLYFLALGFTPLDEVLAAYSEFLNKSRVRVLQSSYTLDPRNAAETLVFDTASDCALNIPAHPNFPVAVGTCITVATVGSSIITFTPASGVSLIRKSGLPLTLSAAGTIAQLIKIDEGRWLLIGGLA